MKCLNLQDHQAKTNNYRKGLAYLKNRATTSQNQILHLQKMEKKYTQADNNRRPSNQKKQKKGRMENHRINWNTTFKMAINNHLSNITLNVNGLNFPIKQHIVAEWIKR